MVQKWHGSGSGLQSEPPEKRCRQDELQEEESEQKLVQGQGPCTVQCSTLEVNDEDDQVYKLMLKNTPENFQGGKINLHYEAWVSLNPGLWILRNVKGVNVQHIEDDVRDRKEIKFPPQY